MQNPLDISHEITVALTRNTPVVALESSLIAHGLPSPKNVETALAMEENIRAAGAIPATIGVIEGKVRVGLTKEEIERLGEGTAPKLATRDLPYAVAKKTDGGTTVSATARIAAAAGISVMATGGIGGVHRGFDSTLDISADLWEFVRTPILIVCSGAKAILDIPATAQWLETHSIPIYGLGCDDLPAFYSRTSGIAIPNADDAAGVADIAKICGSKIGLRSAIIIAVPIPAADELDINKEIDQAAKEAQKDGVSGKALTPWLLSRIGELTNGKSLDANIALLKNNATAAAEIAIALQDECDRRIGFNV